MNGAKCHVWVLKSRQDFEIRTIWQPSEIIGKSSGIVSNVRTSSGFFWKFGYCGYTRISRIWLRKSWQVYKHWAKLSVTCMGTHWPIMFHRNNRLLTSWIYKLDTPERGLFGSNLRDILNYPHLCWNKAYCGKIYRQMHKNFIYLSVYLTPNTTGSLHASQHSFVLQIRSG